jgi:hypothetical protein
VPDNLVGDLLREFYAKYGTADEGPPPDLNVCALFGIDSANISADLEADVDLLKGLCADSRLSALVQHCNQLLEEIRHSPQETLYKEIDAYLDDMEIDPIAVYYGILGGQSNGTDRQSATARVSRGVHGS